eukprot:SAG31_NODE_952_length_10807_cov_4.193127_3_plen_209_part_00
MGPGPPRLGAPRGETHTDESNARMAHRMLHARLDGATSSSCGVPNSKPGQQNYSKLWGIWCPGFESGATHRLEGLAVQAVQPLARAQQRLRAVERIARSRSVDRPGFVAGRGRQRRLPRLASLPCALRRGGSAPGGRPLRPPVVLVDTRLAHQGRRSVLSHAPNARHRRQRQSRWAGRVSAAAKANPVMGRGAGGPARWCTQSAIAPI